MAEEKFEARQLLTVAEVAGAHRVSARTIYRMIERGDAECTKVGGKTFLTAEQARAIMKIKGSDAAAWSPGEVDSVEESIELMAEQNEAAAEQSRAEGNQKAAELYVKEASRLRAALLEHRRSRIGWHEAHAESIRAGAKPKGSSWTADHHAAEAARLREIVEKEDARLRGEPQQEE